MARRTTTAEPVNIAVDRLSFLTTASKKKSIQLRLREEDSNFSTFARVLTDAYLEGKRITVDGKDLGPLLKRD